MKFVDGRDPANFARRDRRQHPRAVPRDDRQPAPRRRATSRRVADGRPRARRPAHRRQHVRPAARPADRARRGHRHPLGDQVDRRPRHRHRRRRRRRRQVRLGRVGRGSTRTSSSPDPSLPRRDVYSEAFGAARVHPQAARPGPARHRRRAQPVQRVPVPPGARDAAAAHRAPQPERAGGRPAGSRTAPRSSGSTTRASKSHPTHDVATRVPQGRLRRRSSRSAIKGGAEAGRRLIDSVEAVQPAGERRRREEPDHPPGQHHPPAADRRGAGVDRHDRRTSSGCRWASSTSTTSSPTSTRRCAPRPTPSAAARARHGLAPMAPGTRTRGRPQPEADPRVPRSGPPGGWSSRRPRGARPRGRRRSPARHHRLPARRARPGRAAGRSSSTRSPGSADAAGDWWTPLIGPGPRVRHRHGRRPVREPARRQLRLDRADVRSTRRRARPGASSFPGLGARRGPGAVGARRPPRDRALGASSPAARWAG